MNRLFIAAQAIAVLSLASVARAQDAAAPAAEAAAPAADTADQIAKLEGKIAALEEQYAETKGDVAGLKRLKLSGYMQARYAWQDKGLVNYNKAEATASPDRDNFFIRRCRFKAVYDADVAQFVLQLDAIPSGLSVKEAYAEVKIPSQLIKGLAVDAGLQLMPFGYDVGVRSSSDLDLLERYRGAGYWLKGEYDLGATVKGSYGPINFRGGIFNGNGVDGGYGAAGRDNDQLKDFIGRLGFDFGFLTGGVSGWYGKTIDYKAFPNKTYDRNRIGADAQLYLDLLPIGGTALKGEFIAGKTGIGTQGSPVTAAYGADPGRAGHAWHATLTQNLGKTFQVAARYEQFTKNNNLVATPKTLKSINELDVALHAYVGGNYKLTAAYWHPMDGQTVGTGTGDPKGTVKNTDQWVVQAQAKF
jgi:hypothetical protein